MKIDGTQNAIQLDAYVRQSRNQQKGGDSQSVGKGTTMGVDKVELSSQALEIQKAAQLATEIPEERDEKVNQVKMDIQNGTYNISSAKVATDMLRESFENDQILQGINTHA
jgi:negative regulator of flagellin synthesis FlgM